MSIRKSLPVVKAAVVWLFLLQALRVLFTTLFGVIYDAVFDQSLSFFIVVLDLLLIVLATLTPLLLRYLRNQSRPRLAAALLVLLARIPLSLEDPTLRLYASIVILAGAAFYIAYLLWNEPQRLMAGLIAGLGADQLLRALDYTYDPTLRPGGLPIVIGIALVTAILSLYLYLTRERTAATQASSETMGQPHPSSGLALGAALFVQGSLLALPNALTHWSGLGYGWAAPLLLLVTLLPLGPAMRAWELYLAIWLWPMGSVISIVVILVCLALAALCGGAVAVVSFLIAQLWFLLNLTSGVIHKRVAADPQVEARRPGLQVSLGLLLFLLLSFAFAFTFTYPYTLPLFRGLGMPVLLIGTLVALLPAVNVSLEPEIKPVNPKVSALNLGAAATLTVLCALFTQAPTLPTETPGETLRLATYNIHYGFDSDWRFDLEEIARTIETENVDVIALQEVDAGRITSLSVDDALWLGQRLNMHIVYQPTLEKLSGIALLSRYPLATSDGQWLTSALEQTAIVHGAIETERGLLHVYGIWLGLEPDERATQLAEALDYIGAASPAALGGDFNATPDSPIYARLLDAGLDDPFITTNQEPAPTSPSINPSERIDYVWLRGLTARDAWVADSTASDHRIVITVVNSR